MDPELIFDAFWVSAVIAILVVVVLSAIIYAVIKRKRDYDSTGIPKLVDKPERTEGSSRKEPQKMLDLKDTGQDQDQQ